MMDAKARAMKSAYRLKNRGCTMVYISVFTRGQYIMEAVQPIFHLSLNLSFPLAILSPIDGAGWRAADKKSRLTWMNGITHA